MEMIFNIIQRLLDKKRNTITTEEELSTCTTIQRCLDCRTYFYKLDYYTIFGMFKFLGETDARKINTYYDMLHMPQLEAKYAYRTIVPKDEQDMNQPKKL